MTTSLDFQKMNGLLPCVVQDAYTNKVLMVAYMNEEALQKTIAEKRGTFYSRTRKQLWTKGETSGNFLNVVELISDCDKDAVLLKVIPTGPTCHTGKDTCFNEVNQLPGLAFLEKIILDRKQNPKTGSYTNKLLDSGINAMAQKVGEEAVELVIESKDNNREKFLGEAADLMYHTLVLLAAKNCRLEDVVGVLRGRHGANTFPADSAD